MVTSALDLYDKLLNATDDKTRARVLAEAFDALEERFPNLAETATRRDLSETELRLTTEIEYVRAELNVDIERVRAVAHLAPAVRIHPIAGTQSH